MTAHPTDAHTPDAALHPPSRLRALLVLAGFAAVGLAALAWAAFAQPLPRLIYNPSDSVPVGWYRVDLQRHGTDSLPRPLSVGSLALTTLPPDVAALARGLPPHTLRCSNVWARSRRNTSASSPVRYASTACRWPLLGLPTGWAGRCHPCSFAVALRRANCSC